MIRHRTFWLTALLALPAACSGSGADRGVAGNKAAAAPTNETIAAAHVAAASNGTAQSEIAAATAVSADCPYATRNFRAGWYPAQAPNTGHRLEIDWESLPDARRRYAELNSVDETPLVVVELLPGTRPTSPDLPTGWMEYRSVPSYNVADTHVVLRCGGRELARVAIPPRP